MNERETIPDDMRQKVLERDGYRCRYCDSTGNGKPLHMDHVYPVSRGGETTVENLVAACYKCNSSKRDRVGKWPPPARVRVWPARNFADALAMGSILAMAEWPGILLVKGKFLPESVIVFVLVIFMMAIYAVYLFRRVRHE